MEIVVTAAPGVDVQMIKSGGQIVCKIRGVMDEVDDDEKIIHRQSLEVASEIVAPGHRFAARIRLEAKRMAGKVYGRTGYHPSWRSKGRRRVVLSWP